MEVRVTVRDDADPLVVEQIVRAVESGSALVLHRPPSMSDEDAVRFLAVSVAALDALCAEPVHG